MAQIESEVRFLGATLITPEEDVCNTAFSWSSWASRRGFVTEEVKVSNNGGTQTLIRMPDYKVPRGPA